MTAVNDSICYEQPLNERMRTFLRLEYLFDSAQHFLGGNSQWDSRHCLDALLEIIDLMGRSDVRTELIKELERHANSLSALQNNPGVDPGRLSTVLGEINGYLMELRDVASQPGHGLRRDELVGSIRQRSAIPGGTCNFDLPAYHYWLHKPVTDRRASLEEWHRDLMVVRRGMKLALHMVRHSTTPTAECALRGFFQRPIEPNVACQIVRVVLPAVSPYFPEISGGRHRFTVRFMEQWDSSERPVQTENDVSFELRCCIL
ncbi:MAG: cell division protein ZapD [Gammaproteobacteria bacterium]|nr:cell division protein ZapD [Gammaproteobacteria bacterium]